MIRLRSIPIALAVLVLAAAPVSRAPARAEADADRGLELPPVHEDARGALDPDGAPKTDKELIAGLLDRLATVKDADAAEPVEQAILRLWLHSDSATVEVLMSRAISAMEDEDYSMALEMLNAVVEIKPDYVEGWNKRATLFFRMDDLPRSLSDVEKTLAIEPRHFGALSGLGLILQELGDKKGALEAFRRALAVNPHLEGAQRAVRELAEDVEGRGI